MRGEVWCGAGGKPTCKASAGEGNLISGFATVWHTVDWSWGPDIIAAGAFGASLPAFLEKGFVGGMNHDWDHPVGRPTLARETEYGLEVEALLVDTPAAEEVASLVRAGVVSSLSIGFRAQEWTWLSGSGVLGYWAGVGYEPTDQEMQRAADGARLITAGELIEFSPVAVPANELARLHRRDAGIRIADAGRVRGAMARARALGVAA